MIEYENLNKLNQPFFEDFNKSFKKFLDKGWFILGSEVSEFEKEFANYCNSEYCLGVANGLDALTIALKTYGFKKGSEVIVPSNTYIATILAILNCDLKPVFVEPKIDTYNLDPDLIEQFISKKTVAIMVVHLYGKTCEMDKILSISNQYGLKLVEDCAQSHGSKFNNQLTGSFGDFGAFSFYPTKNLGALGDAGCLTIKDEQLYEKAKKIRNYGSKVKYYNDVVGMNSRLDELQASFLRIKLRSLDQINNHKRKLAEIYQNNLKDTFVKPKIEDGFYDVYHIYNIRHSRRDDLKKYLLSHNIITEIHYPVPPHQQKALQAFKTISNNQYPISTEIHNTTLSLPISFMHTEEEILKVIEVMNKF